MFILIIVIILGTTISILGSIYYNTITLQHGYWTVNSYYWAYYGAISSIERWLLMTKLKYPGYEWVWWFKWWSWIWAPSNSFAWNFWKLNQGENSMVRSVDSKTNKIVWTIDSNTVRTISFAKYSDDDVDSFSWGTVTLLWYSWINDWLEFSWKITPTRWTKYDESISRDDADFNREFLFQNTWYTVRSLQRLTWQRDNEKDYELTWDFNFKKNTCNPRSAQSWTFTTGYEDCISDLN